MMLLVAAAVAAAPCPYPADRWTAISAKRDLPAGAAVAFGDLAENGAPFQLSDALPPGPHPPFARFVTARGRGCELVLDYEHGGIAHSWRSAQLRFVRGHWVLLQR